MKILVAEDDKFLASAYRVKFTKQDWQVDIVADGQEVFDYLNKNQPDLIVLDLIMPNIDGFEVLENLPKYPNAKNVPVIVASNLGQKEDFDKAMKLGATDFIVKSEMPLDSLVEKITKILSL